MERKRALKQAQGAANLHLKSWKQKDHLPNVTASKTGRRGENSQRRRKKQARFQKEKYSKQY